MTNRTEIISELRTAAGSKAIMPQRLTAAVTAVFESCGMPRADAEICAEIAVWAQQHGTDSHGVVQLPLYTRGLLDRTINPQPNFKTEHPMPCCAVLDADHGLGLLASHRANELAIGFAKTHGLGAVAVRASSHFGAAGYFTEQAAKAGMIGMAMTNAMPAIAPTGSTEGLLGTNPIGVSFPVPNREPITADLATAMVARSRIRQALAAGQKTIPEGWALDPNGDPTTDPAIAVKGSLVPIGGPKGYALSLMVEILCSALSDGEPGFQVTYENMVKRPSNISHFFLVMNPQGFAGANAYGARAGHIADVIGKAKPKAGAEPPRLPGARGQAISRKASREGIAVSGNLQSALNNVATMLESHGTAA